MGYRWLVLFIIAILQKCVASQVPEAETFFFRSTTAVRMNLHCMRAPAASLARFGVGGYLLDIIKIGTLCSCTDSPMIVFHAISEAVGEFYQVGTEAEQLYGVEINPDRREFLNTMVSPPRLYGD